MSDYACISILDKIEHEHLICKAVFSLVCMVYNSDQYAWQYIYRFYPCIKI